MLRNCARLAMRLSQRHTRLHRCPAFHQLSPGLCQLTPSNNQDLTAMSSTAAHLNLHKDFALPNSSWKKEMMDLYDKFTELTKTGTWKRLPSYIHGPLHPLETEPSRTRNFTRNLNEEGMGLEYVVFLNLEDNRAVGLFQIGPYLEGPPGLIHGGCTATIIDIVAGMSAVYAAGPVFTANLNTNYRNPVPLGSVIVVESHVDRIEGRKAFILCRIRSADDTILYTESTGLFIRPKGAVRSDS